MILREKLWNFSGKNYPCTLHTPPPPPPAFIQNIKPNSSSSNSCSVVTFCPLCFILLLLLFLSVSVCVCVLFGVRQIGNANVQREKSVVKIVELPFIFTFFILRGKQQNTPTHLAFYKRGAIQKKSTAVQREREREPLRSAKGDRQQTKQMKASTLLFCCTLTSVDGYYYYIVALPCTHTTTTAAAHCSSDDAIIKLYTNILAVL